jgi:hypothetical protein
LVAGLAGRLPQFGGAEMLLVGLIGDLAVDLQLHLFQLSPVGVIEDDHRHPESST